MKNLSLKSRILFYFLAVPVGTFTVISLLAIIDMAGLKRFALNTGRDLSHSAARESMTALESESRKELMMLAEGQAVITELQLKRIIAEIKNIASLYKDIHNKVYRPAPNGFTKSSTSKDIARDNFSYFCFAPDADPALLNKYAKQVSMLRNAFKFLCAFNNYSTGLGIALPKGIFFKYGWYPIPASFDPRQREWYKRAALEPEKIFWTGPYSSIENNRSTITCSMGVKAQGELIAVVMIDISPRSISDDFIATLGTGGYAFIVNDKGELIAQEGIADKQLRWELGPEIEKKYEQKLINSMIAGDKGIQRVIYNKEEVEVAYSPLKTIGWSLGIAMPRKLIVSSADKIKKTIKRDTELFQFYVDRFIQERGGMYITLGLILIVFVGCCAVWIARKMHIPILRLENGAAQIGQGNLDVNIKVKSRDEFQDLAESFNNMTLDLKKHIEEFKQNVTVKEQMKRELAVAARIQRSMLPDKFPAFPGRDEVDVYAEMRPAKEVGGDFYDFLLIDENKMFFAVGDISGKGLPAAMFMARTITLLRHEAIEKNSPDRIFLNAGNELEQNNDSCMFVTGVCGIIDVSTGETVIANAGHPPPFIRRDISFTELKMPKGIVIGALPLTEGSFELLSFKMEKGDSLILYTDGVSEAFNSRQEQFGEKRIGKALSGLAGANPKEQINAVIAAVEEFAGAAPQSDDITMLAIKYHG
jgi:sigma-B regulation protein RsbU (phosphoserine phosphatase)